MAIDDPVIQEATPAEDDPDLSDLRTVIVNVETVEGRQLSMIWEQPPDGRLSLTTVDHEQRPEEGLELWRLRVTSTSP